MPKQLYNLFVETELLTEEQFNKAVETAKEKKANLLTVFENLNILKEKVLLDKFSIYYNVQSTEISEKNIQKSILELIPNEIIVKYNILPIDRMGNNIILAMSNPRDLEAIDAIRFATGYRTKPTLASALQLKTMIDRMFSNTLNIKKMPRAKDGSVKVKKEKRQEIGSSKEDAGTVINIVNQALITCKNKGASDIHIEAYENLFRIRMRIDGTLHEFARPPLQYKAALISRIKIMAKLDIAETRLPQDGAINIQIQGSPIDFRVSTIPTLYGEKIVMRILDKSALKADMTSLGFTQIELDAFMKAIKNPFGMVLVTGPTGSGKTTTLYSALSELNTMSENLMTAEDPIEYNLEGINQVQMKSAIGLDFSKALRAFLRQDPDIIMVGEVRDLETAQIAIKAALTGHMVLSTLHTNSAIDTISRLLNMGIEPFNLIASLNCITAQRLMKKICLKCRVVDDSVTPKHLIDLGLHPSYAEKYKAYKGKGCSVCNGTGNKGRVACHEVLTLSSSLKEAIIAEKSAIELKKIAVAGGFVTLRQSAIKKLLQGEVNAIEVIKSTSADDDKTVAA